MIGKLTRLTEVTNDRSYEKAVSTMDISTPIFYVDNIPWKDILKIVSNVFLIGLALHIGSGLYYCITCIKI